MRNFADGTGAYAILLKECAVTCKNWRYVSLHDFPLLSRSPTYQVSRSRGSPTARRPTPLRLQIRPTEAALRRSLRVPVVNVIEDPYAASCALRDGARGNCVNRGEF